MGSLMRMAEGMATKTFRLIGWLNNLLKYAGVLKYNSFSRYWSKFDRSKLIQCIEL